VHSQAWLSAFRRLKLFSFNIETIILKDWNWHPTPLTLTRTDSLSRCQSHLWSPKKAVLAMVQRSHQSHYCHPPIEKCHRTMPAKGHCHRTPSASSFSCHTCHMASKILSRIRRHSCIIFPHHTRRTSYSFPRQTADLTSSALVTSALGQAST
jgi:hypothetical protein